MSKFTDSIISLLSPKAEEAAFLMAGVTVFGDSIMYGISPYLKDYLPENFAIHNLSIPGDTARNAWMRFPYTLRSHTSVLIEHGTNDLTAGQNPVPYIKKMVDYAVKEGRQVFLTGILPRSDKSTIHVEINEELAYIAAGNPGQIQMLPTARLWLDSPNFFLSDGLHPTADTSKMLARFIADGMKQS